MRPSIQQRLFQKLRASKKSHDTQLGADKESVEPVEQRTKDDYGSKGVFETNSAELQDISPNVAAQEGVAKVEAITLSWTKTSLGFAYVL